MRKKLLSLFVCGFISTAALAQPANDECATAQNLGTLPAPAACPSGVGAVTTINSTLVGATPGNPYTYMPNCTGAATQTSSPANDIWYSFTASGYQAVITINSAFADPNIAMYSGTCGALGGGVGGCVVGSGGTATLTVEQMVIGTTYLIQVSSLGAGTFTMTVRNNIDCNNCLTSATLTANPPPVNGAYQPGQTVNFCYKVNNYQEVNTNWLHGIQLGLGAGWNTASIVASAGTSWGNDGSWNYYPAGITDAQGTVWPRGWYFDRTTAPLGGGASGDGNPGNNFGDEIENGTGVVPANVWQFCFSVQVASACNPGSNLSVTFNTTGDGESGTWTNLACVGDPPTVANAVGSCCPPIMSSTPATCVGSDGSATATPQGAAGPYTYQWSGPAGYTNTSTGVAGANTISNIPAGTYTVTITDATLCAISNTVTVGGNPAVPPAPTTAPISYCLNAAAVPLTATPSAGGTLNWYGTNAVGGTASGTAPTPVTTPAGPTTYYVSQTVGGCEGPRAPLVVTINPLPTPVVNSNSPVCAGTAINLTASGGTGYAWTGPNAFASAAQNPTIASATAAMAGTYSVTVTDANGCQAQGTTPVVVNPLPVPVVGSNSPVCVVGTINLTASGGTGYAWTGPNAFASATQNPSIALATAAMSGTYSVTVTDGNGCQAQGTTPVVVNPAAPPVVGSNSPVCVGATINLTCSAGTSYAWTGPNGFTDVAQNPSIPSATVAMDGTYSVTVTYAGGCSSSGTTSVTVNPLPVPVVNSNSPVCEGATINLTASGGTGYAWTGPNAFASAAQNPSIASATAAMAGTYSVTVTDANGCQAPGTTPVVVNPLPVPVVGSNSPVCAGATINLTASGGTGYAWTGPNAFASANQNPSIASATAAMAGTYSVTVTDANGCQAQGTTPVVVNPLPVPVVNSNSPVCASATINFTANGGTGYAWTGPAGFTDASQNPSIASATAAMSGTYSVMVTDANGCQAQGTTPVTVNPLPVPVVGSNSPVCEGVTINLTANGGTGYAWTGPNAFASANQNPSLASATAAMAGTYSVTVTDANGCQAQGTTPVVVNPLPVPAVNSNSPVCVGATINLTASGGTGYAWTGPNAFASATQNPSLASATLAMDGTYSVTVTDANGCQAQGTASVTVNALPTPTANNIGGPYCVNGTINLTSSPAGMAAYNWTGPLGFTSTAMDTNIILITVPMSGTYTITVTDGNGCVGSTTTGLVVNALPAVTADNNGPVCVGTTLSLNSTGGVSYAWSGPNGFSSTPSANPTIPAVTLAATGTYTVIATDVNGCTNANLTAVIINPNPTPVANTNGPVCVNSVLTLSATQPFATYNWTGPNGFASSAASPVISPVTAAAAGTYSLSATDANGCPGNTTISTTIHPLPTATLNAIAPGCAPACRDFFLSSSNTLVAWSWNLGNSIFVGNDTVLQHCYEDPGIYNVSVYITDNNNCSDSVHFNNWVTIYEVPEAEFTHGPNDVTVLEPEVHFTDLSIGTNITGYAWNFGDPFSSTSLLSNPSFTYPDAGYYEVMLTVVNGFGCVDSVVHMVYIPEDWAIYVPTAFSPNDDGVNDSFFPQGVGIDEDRFKMWIFDRWGNQLFYTEDWNSAWDGKVQGHSNMVQEDVYIWKIMASSFKGDKYSETGHVTVVR